MKLFKPTVFAVLIGAATAVSCSVDLASSVGNEADSTASTSTSTSTTTSTTTSLASTASSEASASSTDGSSAVTLGVVAPIVDCSDLLSVNITDIGGSGSNITAAAVSTSDGIDFCIVTGTVPPAMSWEVMLPVSTWTQRYMQIGCGGLCGTISTSAGASSGNEDIANGNFVLGATDMDGGTSGTFGLDEDKRIEFAYLAQHQTAEIAKALIKAYYGQEQAYAYFNGCSDGGREAVMEALRYPDDFDGIIAGAPAMLFSLQNSFHHGWLSVSNTNEDGTHIVLSDRLDILHDAVVDACDALDGMEDGLLTDPRLCSFDVTTIECASDATDNSTCLTTTEVEAIIKFYSGPIDTDSGEHLTVGEVQYSSELGWSGVFVGETATTDIMSTNVALSCIKYLLLEDYPGDNYTLSDFAFENSSIDLVRPRHPLFDSVSADLSAFYEAGRKLILWHGWADPQISPRTTIAYYEALQDNMGEDVVDDFVRMYLLPGVYHCGDGEGPSALDLVSPIMNWVEGGEAPYDVLTSSDTSTSSSSFGQWASESGSGRRLAKQASESSEDSTSASGSTSSTVTRPVYPYPLIAKYIGTGDINDAANFEAGEPLYTNKTAYWLAQDFFNPYTPIEG